MASIFFPGHRNDEKLFRVKLFGTPSTVVKIHYAADFNS